LGPAIVEKVFLSHKTLITLEIAKGMLGKPWRKLTIFWRHLAKKLRSAYGVASPL
jgi:hypothetical protein